MSALLLMILLVLAAWLGWYVGHGMGWNARIEHERELGPAAIYGWQNILCPCCRKQWNEPLPPHAEAQPAQGDEEVKRG